MKKFYVSIYIPERDGEAIARNLTLAEVIKLLSSMNDTRIAYVGHNDNTVSYYLMDNGTVHLELDDCQAEDVATYQQIEKSVNEWRELGIIQRGATREEMKCLWEQREEYARLSKMMQDEQRMSEEEETTYWGLRTIEKLVLYGDTEA